MILQNRTIGSEVYVYYYFEFTVFKNSRPAARPNFLKRSHIALQIVASSSSLIVELCKLLCLFIVDISALLYTMSGLVLQLPPLLLAAATLCLCLLVIEDVSHQESLVEAETITAIVRTLLQLSRERYSKKRKRTSTSDDVPNNVGANQDEVLCFHLALALGMRPSRPVGPCAMPVAYGVQGLVCRGEIVPRGGRGLPSGRL